MIPVLVIVDEANGNEIYRLDEQGEGDRFFKDINRNQERREKRMFYVDEYTEIQWKEVELNGELEAGEIDFDEYERQIEDKAYGESESK